MMAIADTILVVGAIVAPVAFPASISFLMGAGTTWFGGRQRDL